MDETKGLYRVLDANANRASEGLRTIEEIVRMILEDEGLSLRIKTLRHRLQSAIDQIPMRQRLLARDTAGDVGTRLSTDQEKERSGPLSIAQAASGRLQQSLRCLEEFSKALSEEWAIPFEQIRYASYDLTAEVCLRLEEVAFARATRPFPKEKRLYLLIDCQMEALRFRECLESLCQAGVDCVQVRDKNRDDRILLEYLTIARDVTRQSQKLLVVNDRADLARCVEADALHVGQEDLPIEAARKIVGTSMWIGVSTHSIDQAVEAEERGADYIGCGPTFPSRTKAFSAFAGLDFLRQVSERIQIPAFAIGGIDASNVDQVLAVGIERIAVQGGLLNQPKPAESAQLLAHKLENAVKK